MSCLGITFFYCVCSQATPGGCSVLCTPPAQPVRACFTYTLLTYLAFLHTCPRPQPLIALIKGQGGGGSLGTDKSTWIQFLLYLAIYPSPWKPDCGPILLTICLTRWSVAPGPCFRVVSCPHPTRLVEDSFPVDKAGGGGVVMVVSVSPPSPLLLCDLVSKRSWMGTRVCRPLP